VGSVTWRKQCGLAVTDRSSIYKSGKCTDFTIVAGGREFPVHRVLLSTRSQYFNAVCDGNFAVCCTPSPPVNVANIAKDTKKRCIILPESEQTASTMLQEIYEVYNSTTGSVFTCFALRRALEKDRVMADLLALVASDKVCSPASRLPISRLTH
jgi:histone acetyltransferase HTATIP